MDRASPGVLTLAEPLQVPLADRAVRGGGATGPRDWAPGAQLRGPRGTLTAVHLAFEHPLPAAVALALLAALWVALVSPVGLRSRGACAAGLGALGSLLAGAGDAAALHVHPGLPLALWLAGAVLAGSLLLGDGDAAGRTPVLLWSLAVAGLCLWSTASLLWIATVSAGGV